MSWFFIDLKFLVIQFSYDKIVEIQKEGNVMAKKNSGTKIPMTRRELEKARRNAHLAAISDARTNAHRLLLFYSIECGLKALYLKNNKKEVLDKMLIDKLDVGHNINKMLDALHAEKRLHLPNNLSIKNISNGRNLVGRNCDNGQINQVWRYGAEFTAPDDDLALEKKLETISNWIGNYPR